MTKTFLYLILLCLGTTVASEVEYIIRPSQAQSCGDRCNVTESVDNCLTLSQFVNNSTDYLTNDTGLIFSPGNYSLESELIIKNVPSFSMFAWPSFSSKVVIICSHNARFGFRNVSIVTVSGLEFVGCLENHVVSVGQFQLEDSSFFGNGQAIVSGTVLTIEESTANLDRVAFVSNTVDQRLTAFQELLENCTAAISTTDRVIGISLRRSIIRITQSWFEGNDVVLGGVIYDEFGSDITIVNTTFVNNSASDLLYDKCNLCNLYCNITRGITSGVVYANSHGSTVEIYDSKFVENVGEVIFGDSCNMIITHTKFINNKCSRRFAAVHATNTNLVISHSTFTNNSGKSLEAKHTNVSISYCEFVGNYGDLTMYVCSGMITRIDHCKFINNRQVLGGWSIKLISITHSEFEDNTATDQLVNLDGVVITVKFNEFINNRVSDVMYMPYYTTAENLTNNVFINNSATFEVFISSECRPGTSLSLGSPHCIPCSKYWHRNLIGIVIAAFIAGIALVIFMLALNMTIAVGTLNGILFYANIVAANADTYFLSFTTPAFVTVFISWLNLDIGFDACFSVGNEFRLLVQAYKALLQLTFPIYIILLVIIVIVASKYSDKFAKIIGKGNPVAVLATMIFLSYPKLFNVILTAFSVSYQQPAYGSRNVDVSRLRNSIQSIGNKTVMAYNCIIIIVAILILLLCVICSALVFSWQWLLRYQDKAIFKWVRYQKLRHFLEPYHAPYTANYRYWTGLLLIVRAFVDLISVMNFSLNPRVDLISTIFIVGGLILLKGMTAKRVYKNWLLDVMETAIHFNLVTFSALTWYNLDYGGNQVAVAYTSVMIIFILLLGVIIFHVLRYTRLYKCSFVEKAFKWINSKLMEKKPIQEPSNDAPEELDGFQLERTTAGDQELPTVTYSTIELPKTTENQEETAY